MKQSEFTKCILCDRGVAHDGNITFYSLRLAHLVIDRGAVQRQAGLEMMLGRAAALAQVLGPNEDMAKEAYAENALICQSCSIEKPVCLAEILERVSQRKEGAN